jgi:hypothetical protein
MLIMKKGKTYDYYVEQYAQMYKEGYNARYSMSYGYSTRDETKAWLEATDSKTLLDYGSGTDVIYSEAEVHKHWNLNREDITLYDPAIPEFSNKPEGQFDAVICIDVLEHLPEDSIDYVLEDIFSYGTKLILLKISLSPAHAILPNGENAHISVHDRQWWIDRAKPLAKEGQTLIVNKVVVQE